MRVNFSKKVILFIHIYIFLCIVCFGQERKILGRVLDSDTKKPVAFAFVEVDGAAVSSQSNQLGFFELTIESEQHKSLSVSHIAYKLTQILIPEQDKFMFYMEKDVIELDELNIGIYAQVPLASEDDLHLKDTEGIEDLDAYFPSGLGTFYGSLARELLPYQKEIIKPLKLKYSVSESGELINISLSDTSYLSELQFQEFFRKQPNWVAAKQRGHTVVQDFVLPISSGIKPKIDSIALHQWGREFYFFMQGNLRYPATARRMGIEGIVYGYIELDSSGNLKIADIIKDVGAQTGEEVKRVINLVPSDHFIRMKEVFGSDKYVLPVIYSLGSPSSLKHEYPKGDFIYLSEIVITAIGIEREARFGSTNSPASTSIIITPDRTFRNLEEALLKPASVTRLELINKNIKELDPNISKLRNLVHLDLEGNELEELPEALTQLPKLQELYLYKNAIKNLPSNLTGLKTLKTLSLASNNLTEFPIGLTQLQKLEALDLSGNKISSIPPEIGNLKNLKFLVLHTNNIEKLPEEIFRLRKLERLYIQGNPLTEEEINKVRKSTKKTQIEF